jgi:catechol 2,3-dioxygenase-like lactoylglutathione lyase family enzyme
MGLSDLRVMLVSLLLTTPAMLFAAPVPDEARLPIDLRRTTLIVRDMASTLRFYRDVLGLRVVYDQVIRTPRDAPDDAAAERSLRLVFLQANDDFIGMIGLIQYYKPLKTPASAPEPFSIGSMVFVFNTSDVERRFEAARRLPGVRVIEEPTRTSYPGYDGKSVIPVIVSVLTDPDGYTVELNELLVEEPQRKSAD